MTQKILVCITIQQNSRRLIKKGAELANRVGGELHILHVEHGNSILSKNDSAQLFEELFDYASELGGEVHVVCDDKVPERIVKFIKDMNITQLVLGETMRSKIHRLITKDIKNYITSTTPEVEVMVLEREKPLNIKDEKAFS
ncbi:universal stress protein [Defluviitalea phaphyphila]|uniref:universal stress protein n=1 Tax=Defluviitalea phaphyphila TaxID=1473580 RepID=UPI000730D0B5|nr:universal stress protein [Defluviitalea phaphyphila]